MKKNIEDLFFTSKGKLEEVIKAPETKFSHESHDDKKIVLYISVGIIVFMVALFGGIYYMVAPNFTKEATDPLAQMLEEQELKTEKNEVKEDEKEDSSTDETVNNKTTEEEIDKEDNQTDPLSQILNDEDFKPGSIEENGMIDETLSEEKNTPFTETEEKLEESNSEQKNISGLKATEKISEGLEQFFNDAKVFTKEEEKNREEQKKTEVRSLPVSVALPEGTKLLGSFLIASGATKEALPFPQKEIEVLPNLDIVVLMKFGDTIPYLASPIFTDQKEIRFSVDSTAVAYLSSNTGLYKEEIPTAEKRAILETAITHEKFPELQKLTSQRVITPDKMQEKEIKLLCEEIIFDTKSKLKMN